MTLYDSHCHVDFATNPVELAEGLASLDVRAVSATVTPSAYARASRLLGGFDNIQVGLGLHPWWVADGRLSLHDACEFQNILSSGVSFVSEVGLDFSPRCLASSVNKGVASSSDQVKEVQLEAFRTVISACVGHASFVSIHSTKAESAVLDVLEDAGLAHACTCVFHGFGGSQDQLSRALDMGCYVSVGPRMLASKRGKAYAKIIPAERILLETDAPSSEGSFASASSMRNAMLQGLESLFQIRGLEGSDRDAFVELMEKTSSSLLGFG